MSRFIYQSNITIRGGRIKATGGTDAPGIGPGNIGSGGSLTMSLDEETDYIWSSSYGTNNFTVKVAEDKSLQDAETGRFYGGAISDENNIDGKRLVKADLTGYGYVIWIEPSSHGTVTAVKANDGTFTLTATPDKGYIPGTLTVTYQDNGENKTITPDANGSFAMPEANVTVTATFISMWQRLQAQINDAPDNGTITLQQDFVAQSDDVALSVTGNKTVTLDLNGHKIDRALARAQDDGNVITVNESATLTITGTGKITGGYNSSGAGGIIVKGTLNLKSGSITDNEGTRGGVEVTGGTLVIDGNPVVQGNTKPDGSRHKACNVWLDGKKITVNSLTEGAKISVYTVSGSDPTPGPFADWSSDSVASKDPAQYFFGDKDPTSQNGVGAITYAVRKDTSAGPAVAKLVDSRAVSVSNITNGRVVSIEAGGSTYSGEMLEHARAAKDELVTVTVEPDWSYKTDSMHVDGITDIQGQGANRFTFTMGNSNVIVTPVFSPEGHSVSAGADPSEGNSNTVKIKIADGELLPQIENAVRGTNIDVHVWPEAGYSIRDVRYSYQNARGETVKRQATYQSGGEETYGSLGKSTHYTSFWSK